MNTCDVLLLGSGPSIDEAFRVLKGGGLIPLLHATKPTVLPSSPAIISTFELEVGEDTHLVLLTDSNTAEAGRQAAYEVLAELFDDSEPADDIS
jgi:hypothetical protein